MQALRSTTEKRDHMKLKIFCIAKDAIIGKKQPNINWGIELNRSIPKDEKQITNKGF